MNNEMKLGFAALITVLVVALMTLSYNIYAENVSAKLYKECLSQTNLSSYHNSCYPPR